MDDATQRYISRAIEIAERREDRLSREELAEIASELGLGEEDLRRVDEEIEAHAERGAGYLRHRMWDDAIREYREAATLAPERWQLTMGLAEAYAGRAADNESADDRERAAQLARDVLAVEPQHDAAFEILAQLERATTAGPAGSEPEDPQQEARTSSKRLITVLGLAGIAAAALIGGIALGDMTGGEDRGSERSPASDDARAIDTEPGVETGDRVLPVEFVANAQSDGVDYRERTSKLSVYPERAFYTMTGDFIVTGDVLVERVDARIELMDDDGNVVKADGFAAWPNHEAALRKGDVASFSNLFQATAEAASARISVSLMETTPAAGEFDEGEQIEPKFAVKPPSHLQLEIYERTTSVSEPSFGMNGYFKAEWEFRNVGDQPIRGLTYEVNLLDANGKQLELNRKIATYSSFPPILAGESAIESAIVQVPKSYDRYEIEVVEFE